MSVRLSKENDILLKALLLTLSIPDLIQRLAGGEESAAQTYVTKEG